jgi:cytidyltransferase-like protein
MSSMVLVTGVFNILHAGHCQLLEFASRFGKVVVGINGNEYNVKKNGTATVPLINRVYVLTCNKFVHEVVVFHEDHPGALIKRLGPDFYVKGPDYFNEKLSEQQAIDDTEAILLIHQADKIGNSSDLVEQAPKSLFVPIDYLD